MTQLFEDRSEFRKQPVYNAHDNLGLRFSIDSMIAACFTCALVVLLCSRIVIRLCVPMELSLQILRISDNLKSLEVTKGVDEGRR